jgi:hypothetical protein
MRAVAIMVLVGCAKIGTKVERSERWGLNWEVR